MKLILLSLFLLAAATYPKVDADLGEYDKTVAAWDAEFSKTPSDPKEKSWVILKIDHMVKVDQYMRSYWQTPHKNKYSKEELEYFNKEFLVRNLKVDSQNTTDLKSLIKIHGWFKRSVFDEKTDNRAWLLVQHADHDHDFQKEVLGILEQLYLTGETGPSNYAYLFDRVAASWNDPSKRTLQRYGSQGTCVGPGIWEPIPMEDPDNIDKRRASVGLETMAEYKARFKDICR